MRVEDNNAYLSNEEYFAANCTTKDFCRINRMWLRYLDRTIGRDAPKWEKETTYDEWLASDFSRKEWDACSIKMEYRDGGTLYKFRKEVTNIG